ncbi:MAG TPA: hypothetical protein VMA74_12455 [Dyella sp.]|uniref:hypothetical protein n=1 Tax=Dyella sp. TaxID=1869338 RepID=UPI002CD4A8A8|nr:hypothetical protein [Dyella sp.]HUB90527.1 hypothetical protein [Dyella sp.]
MKRRLLLCLGLVSGVLGASEPPQVVLHGTVTTSSGEHPAWFTLMCTQGHGGALSLQLALVADTAPGFPFDAYEGPGAPASHQPSAELRVGQQSFASVPAAGWYGGDGPGMFVFGIATTPGQRNAITGAVAALSKPGLTLTWIQNSNNLQTPPLMGRFVLDEKQSHALQRIAAPCLPHRR